VDAQDPLDPQPEAAPMAGRKAPRSWWARQLRTVGALRLAVVTGVAAAVTAGLLVAGGTGGSAARSPHGYGQAHGFTLAVLGRPGHRLSLASLAGRPVIVNFFASWCTPCRKETPLIARFYRARHGRLAVIGIDVNDSAHAAMAFVRKSGVSYPVAVDPPPMKTALAYNVPGLPATFFLNSSHQIVKRVFGGVTLPVLTTGAALITRHGS
jgi:cytochrome c biogenesis protein CcmG, thiol:disulfide interchange protein DsbE